MRTHSTAVSLVAFGMFGLAALSARSAFADSTCASDTDCVKGWTCQVTSATGCASAGCAPGQDCPPPPDCQNQEFKSCVPGPCKADSDCATGMVCFTSQVGGCDSAPPCQAGADCPTTTCAPTTQSECVPKYDAPCKADADCGAGFTCTLDSSGCACASAGSAPNSGGSADAGIPVPDPIPPTTCNCPAATTSSCHALPVTCTTAADCASGWTCETVVNPTTCGSEPAQPPTPGGANGRAASDEDVPPAVLFARRRHLRQRHARLFRTRQQPDWRHDHDYEWHGWRLERRGAAGAGRGERQR